MSIIILKNKQKKEKAQNVINRVKQEKGLEAKKYCGKINLKQDPLLYQKRMRNEWK